MEEVTPPPMLPRAKARLFHLVASRLRCPRTVRAVGVAGMRTRGLSLELGWFAYGA